MKSNISNKIKSLIPYIIIIVVVVLIRSFVITPVTINGSSMNNTLFTKDVLFLNKINKNYKQNDIVVVKLKNYETDIIKRIIALPGQSVEIENGQIYIDTIKYTEKNMLGTLKDMDMLLLGKDEYFILGDNRNDSLDSRIFGAVTKKEIKGKVNFRIYPFNKIGMVE